MERYKNDLTTIYHNYDGKILKTGFDRDKQNI